LIHNDHLATPQKMTDSSGTVVWSADYKPFGEATITISTITNNLRFPGEYYDAETGLHYNYIRNHNPAIGRFIESDPIGILEGRNHLYARVGNMPTMFVDPYGLEAQVFIWQPVGWGQSSFGHVSTSINGTTYSFSPGGMTIEPTSTYIARPGNASRGAVGSVLNLTPAQQGLLQACLGGNQGSYSSTGNNCGSPLQRCLNQLQLGTAFSNLLPVSLGNSLMNSGLVTQYNFYYPTQPARGTSAPWAR
jgi:RHS repeat-associated protein